MPEETKRKRFSKDYTQDLIAVAFASKRNMAILDEFLEEDFLPDEASLEAWREMRREFEVTGRCPQVGVVIERLGKKNRSGRYDDVVDFLSEVRRHRGFIDEQSIMAEFGRAIKEWRFVRLYAQMAERYSSEDTEAVMDEFAAAAVEISGLKVDADDGSQIFAGFAERQRRREAEPDRQVSLRYGLRMLDDITRGGALTGELEHWLAVSGGGKSTALVERGVRIAMQGHDVLHVQLEGTEDQCQAKYDANWTGVEQHYFRYRNFSDAHVSEALGQAVSRGPKTISEGWGEIHLHVESKFGGMSTRQLYALVSRHLDRHPRTKAVIVDYAELLTKPEGRFESNEVGRLIAVERDLKNIAAEFDVLVVTASQTNAIPSERTNDPNFHIDRYSIGKSKQIIEATSYFYTINATQDERGRGEARIWIEKLREGRAGQSVRIKQDLAKGRFWDNQLSLRLQESVVPEAEAKAKGKKKGRGAGKTQVDEVDLPEGFEA